MICDYYDSLSVLSSLYSKAHPSKYSKILLEIKESFAKLIEKGFKVSLMWVPSHVGIAGNEKADFLANSVLPAEPEDCLIEIRNHIPNLTLLMTTAWQSVWDEEVRGRYLYRIFQKVRYVPWFKYQKTNRFFITNICRLMTGHVRLNFHLNRLTLVDSAMCDCQTSHQTVNHVLFDCPHLDHQIFLDKILSFGFIEPFEIGCLLADMNQEVFQAIVDMLSLNNIVL